jgi:HAD superfamily hydrolase (TIGR01490 family)
VRLAIFDIDGTLVAGSSERRFWWYLLRRGRQGPRQLLAYLLFLIRYLPTGGIYTTRKNKAYLSGLHVEEINALAREFVNENLAGELYLPTLRRLREHLARGDLVVLMSGTLHPIARALAALLGVRHVCATLASQRNGIFLAQPPEIHPYDAAKLSLAAQLAAEFHFSLDEVTAYGDSWHDIDLLKAAGHAVAVRPDARLRKFAGARGWEVLGQRKPARLVFGRMRPSRN